MAIITGSKVNRMGENVSIQNAFSTLRKNMTEYEVQRNAKRTATWKSNRSKYNDDLDKIEESLK